ncbi:MAG TPA: DMT family transporter [Candidatus Thermoplasmatota archaeon]|nr:DMT family transporter [Candidatus Thermoplasmatota archaeon]
MDRARVPDAAVLAFVQVLFGSLSVVGKVALPQVGPLALVAVRTGCAALILVALERVLVGHKLARGDVRALVVLSLFGVILNQLFFLVGLSMTTAVDAVVLITTIPAFTLAVAMVARRERFSPRKGAGMAVAFAGVVVLVGASALEFGSATFVGNLLVVINSLFYSVFLVASRPVLERMPPLTLTAGTFAVAAVVLLPVGLLGLGAVAPGKPDLLGWAAIAYIVLGPTVTTYFLVSFALVRVPASTVAAFVYLQPLAGGVLAVLLLGEAVPPDTVAAAALIFAGVGLVAFDSRGRRRFVPEA